MDSAQLSRLADEDLMPLLAMGQTTALEVLYDRHGGIALALAYRVVGDRSAAEDVVQEAFLSLWRSGARYDRALGSVRNWLLSVVRNRAVDLLRRESVRPRPGGPLELVDEQPATETTESEALRRAASEEVRGVLGELPGEQRRVIELAYFGGYTHVEIAQLLGVPLGTIKGRMRLALEKLRGQLAEELP